MTDPVQEQLSASLDGALSAAELDLLVKRIERDAALAATLGRYALIGEALKAEKPAVAPSTFATRVMAALAEEPASRRPAGLSPVAIRRLRPVAGFAVAASVAAIAVISVQRLDEPSGQVADSSAPANLVLATSADDSYIVPTTTATPASLVPATRLTNYVVAHSEYSSPLGRRSVLSGVLAEDEQDDAPQSVDVSDDVDAANGGSAAAGVTQER